MARRSLLPLIVAFKAAKVVVLTAAGVAILFSVRADPVDLLMRAAALFHVPATSHALTRAILAVSNLTVSRRIALAAVAFAYAAVMAVEGLGLHWRRPWARWLTIAVTASFIPLEVYEVFRHLRPGRVAVLAINALVFVYLLVRREEFA